LILTAAWTGLASVIAAIPFIYYQGIGAPDLLYAAGAGMILMASIVASAIFFLISLILSLCYLVKRIRT